MHAFPLCSSEPNLQLMAYVGPGGPSWTRCMLGSEGRKTRPSPVGWGVLPAQGLLSLISGSRMAGGPSMGSLTTRWPLSQEGEVRMGV